MQAWTVESVVALAPDAASASAGQALASERKWSGIGRSDRAAWGLCQGSGKDPYQTRVDLSEPAFKCSCPSRKFPRKHGLGFMLLLAKSPGVFKAQAEPGCAADAARAGRHRGLPLRGAFTGGINLWRAARPWARCRGCSRTPTRG